MEAHRLQASLGDEAERVPAEQEHAEMLAEYLEEVYGADADDEAYGWETDEWQMLDQEAAETQETDFLLAGNYSCDFGGWVGL